MNLSSPEERFFRIKNPIFWTLLATILFFGIIMFFGLAETCNDNLFATGECPPKWKHLVAAPPNEVGDTLAGLAGVLAFIWLIGTVLLQSIELREQRKEFREQRLATQDMANAMQIQTKILTIQNERAEALQAGLIVEEKVEELRMKIMVLAAKTLEMKSSDGSVQGFRLIEMMGARIPSGQKFSTLPIDKLLQVYFFGLTHAVAIRAYDTGAIIPKILLEIRPDLEQIISWLNVADAATKTRHFKYDFTSKLKKMDLILEGSP